MTTLELIEKHGIGHNCLSDAYELGRSDGYSQAETDYHKQTEKDRQSAYDCGYELGRRDAIKEFINWLCDNGYIGFYSVPNILLNFKTQMNKENSNER